MPPGNLRANKLTFFPCGCPDSTCQFELRSWRGPGVIKPAAHSMRGEHGARAERVKQFQGCGPSKGKTAADAPPSIVLWAPERQPRRLRFSLSPPTPEVQSLEGLHETRDTLSRDNAVTTFDYRLVTVAWTGLAPDNSNAFTGAFSSPLVRFAPGAIHALD